MSAEIRTSSINDSWQGIQWLANYLGYSRWTIYQLAAKKKIPHRKMPGKLLFKKSEIDRWLDKKDRGSVTKAK
jgi:excisionase family DNA binding protein